MARGHRAWAREVSGAPTTASFRRLPEKWARVAWPVSQMPWRPSTWRAVSFRTLRSRAKVQWSTYQTSRARLSSQVSALRPLTGPGR